MLVRQDTWLAKVATMVMALLAAVALGGCLDTKADPGYCGTCKPDAGQGLDARVLGDGAQAGGDAQAMPDAMVDANGLDAASDGAVADGGDGDVCVQSCGGGTPVCEAASKTCVQCTASDDDACKGSTGACSADTHECVQCTASEDDACKGGTPVCDAAKGKCVECNVDGECKDPSKSHCSAHSCEPCDTPVQCEHITRGGKKLGVCDSGECVECTGTQYIACGEASDDTPYVCNSATKECSTQKEHGVGDCAACVSDAQCKLGQICAEQRYGSPQELVGHFCFWKRASSDLGGPSGNCDVVRPHIKNVLDVSSIDGAVAEICAPRISTCPALNHISKGCESATAPGTGDSSKCGFTHSQENNTTHENQDGFCVDTDTSPSSTNFECTVPCNNNEKDCSVGVTCDTAPVPDLCTL